MSSSYEAPKCFTLDTTLKCYMSGSSILGDTLDTSSILGDISDTSSILGEVLRCFQHPECVTSPCFSLYFIPATRPVWTVVTPVAHMVLTHLVYTMSRTMHVPLAQTVSAFCGNHPQILQNALWLLYRLGPCFLW